MRLRTAALAALTGARSSCSEPRVISIALSPASATLDAIDRRSRAAVMDTTLQGTRASDLSGAYRLILVATTDTVLEVAAATPAGFVGTWRSGLMDTEAAGHSCASRQEPSPPGRRSAGRAVRFPPPGARGDAPASLPPFSLAGRWRSASRSRGALSSHGP